MRSFVVAALLLSLPSLSDIWAQDCTTGFYPFQTGTVIEQSQYDKKGKISSVSTSKITAVTPTADGFKIGMHIQVKDDKGKEINATESAVECRNGVYYFQFSDLFANFMNSGNAGLSGMDMILSGDAMDMPSALSVGQTFADATSQIQFVMNGIDLMNFQFTTRNRKVEARESITTPAGTFDCFKLTYDLDVKMLGSRTMQVKSWWALGTGMVRQESFNAKGESEGKTELTRIIR